MSQVTSQNALVKDSTVQTLNGKLDNLNATLGGNANIAPVFNTATAYSKGDMVNYNGALYVFTANHSAGAWTGSDAVQTKVSSELSSLRSGLNNVSKAKFINPYSETGGQAIYWNNYSATYANLDNIDISGSGGVMATDTNYPSDSDGWGSLVSFFCGDIRLQIYYSWNNSKLYFRSYFSNTWTAWKNITMS